MVTQYLPNFFIIINMNCVESLVRATLAGAILATGSPAHSQSAQVSRLADVQFGAIAGSADRSISQNVAVCSFRNKPQSLPYSVIAIGSGNGGAFALSSGGGTLPYLVQWADTAGQAGGTLLQPGAPASGFANGANGFDCDALTPNASLTVTILASDYASAAAGSYSGMLQIMVAPQ